MKRANKAPLILGIIISAIGFIGIIILLSARSSNVGDYLGPIIILVIGILLILLYVYRRNNIETSNRLFLRRAAYMRSAAAVSAVSAAVNSPRS